jgi:hypothetical protein
MSFEPFGDDVHKLFFGKAMLIVRAKEGPAPSTSSGQGGSSRVTAESDGLTPAEVIVETSCDCPKMEPRGTVKIRD